MNKLIVTFDKSQEDVPTLVVAEDVRSLFNPSLNIINIFTGEKAAEMWKELNEKQY